MESPDLIERAELSPEGASMQAWIRSSVGALGTGPLVVHSDVLRVGRPFSRFAGRAAWLDAHVGLLASIGRPVWMPTFNYAFTREGSFDVARDPSEVGALTERFRATHAAWRTPVPVFSFAGSGVAPRVADGPSIDPFDERSAFAAMVEADSVLLFYGAPFSSSTIKHHVERLAGGPLYRFDKDFAGRVTLASGEVRDVVLRYHVRPLGRHLVCDDDRLLLEAEDRGHLVCLRTGDGIVRVIAASARQLVADWLQRLRADPLHFLDATSRAWIEPELERLGRRFRREDFESDVP